jgi:glutathione S-transferase
MAVKIHYFPLSQPSRAVIWFAKKHNIAHEAIVVDIFKGETHTPEFKKLSPLMSVPILELENGEVITDSGAILAYLADANKITTEYPEDALKRARVNEALLNHDGLSRLVTINALLPIVGKVKNPELPLEEVVKKIEAGAPDCIWALDIINTKFSKQKFIAGDDWTVADYNVVSELNQLAVLEPLLAKVDKGLVVASYPEIQRYLKDAEQQAGYADNAAPLAGLAGALAAATAPAPAQ